MTYEHRRVRLDEEGNVGGTLKYRIFRTIRCTFPQKIWEENGGASYSPNVAYLACCRGVWGVGRPEVERGHRRQEQDHIFCFKIVFPIFLL